MRTSLVRMAFGGLLALAPVVSGSLPAAAGPPPVVARSIYVVRPDPRLCPSPLCGGYWVALANHARTRCADGLLRPRCYVAFVRAGSTDEATSVPPDGLARARLESLPTDWGDLGILRVEEAWSPIGRSPPTGDFFRVRDTRVRCIRAPCFSFRLGRLNTAAHTSLVSGLDLGPARSSPKTLRDAEAALTSSDGLLASGRVTRSADGGRAFKATQVYLAFPPER